MKRIALLFALALSLLPTGAAAESRAPEPGREPERQEVLRDVGDFGGDALRSDGGLGALRFQKTDRLRETSTRNRAEGAPSPDGIVLPPQHHSAAPSRVAAQSDDVSPLCERLPYHATAPPSRR